MSAPSMLGVTVAMQSAIAATKTVSAITKANPAVLTSTSHGLANGTYLLAQAQGMTQLNNRIIRVANQAANTFEAETEDSTLYDTFSSGTVAALTLGTTFSIFTDFSIAGGEADSIDITTIHDTQKKTRPGMFSATEITGEALWDLADTGLIAAISASAVTAQRAFLLGWPDGKKMAFYGYISASGAPKGGVGDVAKTSIKITASGRPSYWTS
ncbi:phage tail tube protein [Methylomonas sp. MED-D]|uniref:phage tail tube protein n=1 Tax=Methylomonas sp. MED-D TaxID=3418768 RepID=UPI003D04D025